MEYFEGRVDFPAWESEVLDYWEKNAIFAAQEAKTASKDEYVFYDGPPFANGLPHYGHLLASTIKDAVPRYWLMRGYRVKRRFGWDCHGLPVEYEIEKQEGLRGRPDILAMGVGEFNEKCRASVLFYADEWRQVIKRMGRWVDWEDQYRTMDRSYMEGVWGVFAELYKKGLIYQGFKVVAYSPRTASVVSNFEANQNYQQVQDPSLVVKFQLQGEPSKLLVWTTTPWTLPANLAIGVGPDVTYVRIKDQETGELWLLAKERLSWLYEQLGKSAAYELIEEAQGEALLGKTYQPLFPYFADTKKAFRLIAADFVTTSEGTGLVHQAPAFGEDDFLTCQKEGIELVDPLDENACFRGLDPAWEGLYVKEADPLICKHLKTAGQVVLHSTLVHSYPFDERTGTPLIYRAVPSWYVAVSQIVPQLLEQNEKINWVPSHLKHGRMGKWLEQARDWAISRNRFWGTPLPVWQCEADHRRVFASAAELESACGRDLPDLHRHFIADITLECEECGQVMRPVDAVFDCWFESGSMPYAQGGKAGFPADFIAEGLDQTRGWFYTLNVLAAALHESPAFLNVVTNGLILDEGGKKMSKRHRNYTPPQDLIARYGADSIRLYLLKSPLLRAENLVFTDKGVQGITRAVLLPLWNAYVFLSTYAKVDAWPGDEGALHGKAPHVSAPMDRWLISRLQSLQMAVAEHMEAYQLYLVVPKVLGFIEELTNWYIRLNRRRFWGGEGQEDAYKTLYYALVGFIKILAPYVPFITDKLYSLLSSGFSSAASSVHLCELPPVNAELIDLELEREMSLLSLAVNLGRSLRQQHKIKTRQVLRSLLVITSNPEDARALNMGGDFLRSELNVKELNFSNDELAHLRLTAQANLRLLGPKLGKKLPIFRKALAAADGAEYQALLQSLTKGEACSFAGYDLSPDDFLLQRQALREGDLIASENGVTVILDTRLDEELISEGYARELVNRIQNLRKDSSLEVSDRIRLQILASDKLAPAVEGFREYIMEETLALSLDLFNSEGTCDLKYVQSYQIEGMSCVIALEPAS